MNEINFYCKQPAHSLNLLNDVDIIFKQVVDWYNWYDIEFVNKLK